VCRKVLSKTVKSPSSVPAWSLRIRESRDSIRFLNAGSFANRNAFSNRLASDESLQIVLMHCSSPSHILLNNERTTIVLVSVRRWIDSKDCARERNSVSTNGGVLRITPCNEIGCNTKKTSETALTYRNKLQIDRATRRRSHGHQLLGSNVLSQWGNNRRPNTVANNDCEDHGSPMKP
jgi:hypothetical protein